MMWAELFIFITDRKNRCAEKLSRIDFLFAQNYLNVGNVQYISEAVNNIKKTARNYPCSLYCYMCYFYGIPAEITACGL